MCVLFFMFVYVSSALYVFVRLSRVCCCACCHAKRRHAKFTSDASCDMHLFHGLCDLCVQTKHRLTLEICAAQLINPNMRELLLRAALVSLGAASKTVWSLCGVGIAGNLGARKSRARAAFCLFFNCAIVGHPKIGACVACGGKCELRVFTQMCGGVLCGWFYARGVRSKCLRRVSI